MNTKQYAQYFATAAFLGLTTCLAVGCSGGSGSSGTVSSISADKPSTAIAAVSAATKTAGTSMGASGISAALVGPVFHPNDITQDCSTHAEPERAGSSINESDADFAGKFMYCKLAYNTEDEESVQGAFTFVQSISCMLEKAGLKWDGQPHSYTLTTGTDCFSANQLTNMGGSQTLSVSVTASAPAAFNSYYDRGVSIDITGQGNFKVATKVSDTKVEFSSAEDNSSSHAGHYGAFAASLDFATGELRYESRQERFHDTTESNSGGFNRHQRLYAKLTTSGQDVTGLVSVSAAQVETFNGAVQTAYGGRAVSASGAIATGIKARLYTNNTASTEADLENASNWSETTNMRCYTSAGPTGTGCDAGIAFPQANAADNFGFTMNGTHTSASTWFLGRGAMTFTSADPAADIQ